MKRSHEVIGKNESRSFFQAAFSRSFFLSASLMVFSIFIYSGYSFYKEYQSKVDDLLIGAQVLGRALESNFEEKLTLSEKSLRFFLDDAPRTSELKILANEANLSSLYFISQTGSGSLICTASDHEDRVGMVDLFAANLEEVKEESFYIFRENDPLTYEPHIFLARKVRKGIAVLVI